MEVTVFVPEHVPIGSDGLYRCTFCNEYVWEDRHVHCTGEVGYPKRQSEYSDDSFTPDEERLLSHAIAASEPKTVAVCPEEFLTALDHVLRRHNLGGGGPQVFADLLHESIMRETRNEVRRIWSEPKVQKAGGIDEGEGETRPWHVVKQLAFPVEAGVATGAMHTRYGCGHEVNLANGDPIYATCPFCFVQRIHHTGCDCLICDPDPEQES